MLRAEGMPRLAARPATGAMAGRSTPPPPGTQRPWWRPENPQQIPPRAQPLQRRFPPIRAPAGLLGPSGTANAHDVAPRPVAIPCVIAANGRMCAKRVGSGSMGGKAPGARPAIPMPKITESALREAALAHLARFATTEAGLRRVLGNRIRRWVRGAAAEGLDPDEIATASATALGQAAAIAARMVQAGAVDDALFAQARARRLRASGRSARATLAHLSAKGVATETARAALDHGDMPGEFTAALVLCRKRRFGPFAAAMAEPSLRQKWLASLARAGFSGEVARRALAMTRTEAEASLDAAR